MTNEIGERNYRKLLYYFENKIVVHFTDLDKIFYNGLILDLNEDKLTMIIRERIKGEMPFLLEFINTDSIILICLGFTNLDLTVPCSLGSTFSSFIVVEVGE